MFKQNESMAASMDSIPTGGGDPPPPAYATGPQGAGYVDPYGQAAPATGFPGQEGGGILGSNISGTQAAMGVAGAAVVGGAGYAGYNAYQANQLPGQQAGGVINNVQNGRNPFAAKQRTYKEQQNRTICLAFGTCCALALIIPGAVLLGVSNARGDDLDKMDPTVDFSTSPACEIGAVIHTEVTDTESEQDCVSVRDYSYSSYSYYSYNSYGNNYRQECTTTYHDICTDVYTYTFSKPGSTQTYQSTTESLKRSPFDKTCSESQSSKRPSKYNQGDTKECWVATSPSTIQRDTGTGDAVGYTCPNTECAILLGDPVAEYDKQVKSGNTLKLVGKILLPIGLVIVVAMLMKEFCCKSPEARAAAAALGFTSVSG